MFALLDKPGYEADSKAIKERLAKEAYPPKECSKKT
jgi:glucose-6-phosphate isomerase